ncbi:transcriptional regulator [Aliidiomarina sedimenti]|uniref:Transcriptional regulator n=2 Tax=Aliidiomarina TaxID=1249554 RepID=A0A432WHW8_9GAMM|nr:MULTISPECIES: transcriptional regulator [Aliidiomarina]RUO31556.1 transcriptional regulator [Aliidiomarina sedimenti]RUO33317.1 transcriptional regulator [Aliidiomarina soli]
MKFSVLVAIVPEELEQESIDAAREHGAGGITVMSARGISNTVKKTFFGLTYDGSQSVLVMVLEKSLSLDVLKSLQSIVNPPDKDDSKGLVFTLGLEHLAGIDMTQVEKFEQHVKQTL